MGGELDILNTGHGHIEIRFEEKDVIETARASRIIADMLRRGYALFVHGPDEKLIRVEKFDEAKGVYIIADGPEVPAEPEEVRELTGQPIAAGLKKKTRGRPRKEVSMSQVKVTAVGRSAGG